MPANVPNPRKVFNWRIEIDGLDQWECQKVTIPEATIEKTEHGDSVHKIKTGGQIGWEDLVIEKLKPMTTIQTWAYDWLRAVQNPLLGGGLLPSVYKRDIVVKMMDSTGTVTIGKWIIEGCFPVKVGYNDLDRMASDNLIETVTLNVDVCQEVNP